MLVGVIGQDFRNVATGGTISTLTTGGKTYRVHTFTSSGTFTVSRALLPFRYLVVAGGQAGVTATSNPGGNGGNGGQVVDTTGSLSTGALTVTIGGSAQNSVLGSTTAVTGSGAAGGPAQSGTVGADGTAGTSSDITGSAVVYGSGGGGGGAGQVSAGSNGGTGGAGAGNGGKGGSTNLVDDGQPGTAGTANRGGGGGGGGGAFSPRVPGSGGAGGSGVVIVRYEILA